MYTYILARYFKLSRRKLLRVLIYFFHDLMELNKIRDKEKNINIYIFYMYFIVYRLMKI